jgi:anti-sigma B factor antagonist
LIKTGMSQIEQSQLFRIDQRERADGTTELALIGEPDLAFADELARRLGDLSSVHKRVMLSLDRLTFIDSSGIRVLINAAIDARRDGWDLEISHDLAPHIRRVIDLTGLTTFLWPQAEKPAVSRQGRAAAPPFKT